MTHLPEISTVNTHIRSVGVVVLVFLSMQCRHCRRRAAPVTSLSSSPNDTNQNSTAPARAPRAPHDCIGVATTYTAPVTMHANPPRTPRGRAARVPAFLARMPWPPCTVGSTQLHGGGRPRGSLGLLSRGGRRVLGDPLCIELVGVLFDEDLHRHLHGRA